MIKKKIKRIEKLLSIIIHILNGGEKTISIAL